MDENAEELFEQGLKHNLRSAPSFDPALARAFFARASAKGHGEAMRNYALMLAEGSGGPKDMSQAIAGLATAYFKLCDHASLEYLTDLLYDEIDQERPVLNEVDLRALAEELESLDRIIQNVHGKIKHLAARRGD